MNVLDVQSITVSMGKHRLLKRVSCQINTGEILAVVGPNGSGKSSLLHAIMNDLAISNGSITVNNKPTAAPNAAKYCSMLPQFSALNFPYTVTEVVALGRIPHASGVKTDCAIVEAALSAMDILHCREKRYTELSGGEKQRTQIARVLAQIWREQDCEQARLLIMDEPNTALDLGHQQLLMQTLKSFSQQGVAILLVLHDLNLAARYASHVLALFEGEVIANDKVNKVLTPEILRQLFGINLTILHDHDSNTPVITGV